MNPARRPEIPSPNLHLARRSRLAAVVCIAIVTIGLVLFFWLPTKIAVPEIFSESYVYGFNNHAAQRILALLLIVAFVAAKALGLRLPASRRPPTAARELTTRTLRRAFLIVFAFSVFMYWVTRPTGGMNDGAYFMDRIHLIERGQHPYRDFEWVYGSLPLYVSIFLGRLLHLTSFDGYEILYLIETLLGVIFLWWGVRFCDLQSGGKRVVFLLYLAFGVLLIQAVTLNYNLFRYSLPLFCVTALTRVDHDASARSRLSTVLAGFAAVAVLLAISPEEGLAYAAAINLFLPLRRLALRRPFLLDSAALITLSAGAVAIANKAGFFTTMKTFGVGAFNLPLWPDPPVLILLGSLFTVGSFLATSRLRDRLPSNVTFIAIFAAAMLPGALGRADPVHIGGYELSLIACALILLWQWPLAWRISCSVFALTFILVPLYFFVTTGEAAPLFGKVLLLHVYRDGRPNGALASQIDAYATRRAERQMGPERGAAKLEAMRKAAGGGASFDPHVVFPGSSPILFAPFTYRPNKLSVYQSPSIDEGYYFGEANITSVVNSERKLDELRAHPERDLIVSTENLDQCAVFIMPPAVMRNLLEYPFVPPVKHGVTVFTPICRFLHDHYFWAVPPSPQTFGYGLMRHN